MALNGGAVGATGCGDPVMHIGHKFWSIKITSLS